MTPERGARKWGELHAFALKFPVVAASQDKLIAWAWLEAWEFSLPSMGCSCKSEWLKIRRLNPPALGGREAFYQWTVERHNDVRRMLGVEALPVEHWMREAGLTSPT